MYRGQSPRKMELMSRLRAGLAGGGFSKGKTLRRMMSRMMMMKLMVRG